MPQSDNRATDKPAAKRERVKEALETIIRYAVAEGDTLAYPDDIELVISAVEREAS